MFTDEEYKAIIQANQHKPTVSEDQRFGVHFEYQDLCARLAKLSKKLGQEGGSERRNSEQRFPALRDKPRNLAQENQRTDFTGIQLGGTTEKRSKSTLRSRSKNHSSNAVLPRSLSPLVQKGSRGRVRSISPLEDLMNTRTVRQLSKKMMKPNGADLGTLAKPVLRKAVKGAIAKRL